VAIKFFDGLGSYKSVAEIAAATHGVISGGINYYPTLGRFGGGALATTYFGGNSASIVSVFASTPQDAALYLGFSCRIADVIASTRRLCNFFGNNNNLLAAIGVTTGGQVYALNKSGSLIAYGGKGGLAPGVWQRIEVRFVNGSTTSNGSLIVHVNGEELLNVAGMDTNRTTELLNRIEIYGPSTAGSVAAYFDDIVVWDESGTMNNTWLGDLRIDELVPASNGDVQDWTPNTGTAWDALNDTPAAADDDAGFISSNTPGQKSSFHVTPVASVSEAILGVRVFARAKKTDAGTRTIATFAKSGLTEVTDASAVDPGTVYTGVFGDIMPVDPATAAPWDDAAVNALQIGVSLAS
jgi:hypothetical protein